MSYTHLSQNERYQIQCLRRGGFSLATIGAELQRSASTISRELRRNGMAIGYASRTAQRQAWRRRHAASARARIDAEALSHQNWSPDQIGGTGEAAVSHERFYQHFAADRQRGGAVAAHAPPQAMAAAPLRDAAGTPAAWREADRCASGHRCAVRPGRRSGG